MFLSLNIGFTTLAPGNSGFGGTRDGRLQDNVACLRLYSLIRDHFLERDYIILRPAQTTLSDLGSHALLVLAPTCRIWQ